MKFCNHEIFYCGPPKVKNKVKTIIKTIKSYHKNASFQVGIVHISNCNKIIIANAPLHSTSDSTIIDKQIVTFVDLKVAYAHLNLSSAVLDTKIVLHLSSYIFSYYHHSNSMLLVSLSYR